MYLFINLCGSKFTLKLDVFKTETTTERRLFKKIFFFYSQTEGVLYVYYCNIYEFIKFNFSQIFAC